MTLAACIQHCMTTRFNGMHGGLLLSSAPVTRVLYTVSVNGAPTFPANDPQPSIMTELQSVNSTSVYEGDMADVHRLEDHYYVTLAGELLRSEKTAISTSIFNAWSNAGEFI